MNVEFIKSATQIDEYPNLKLPMVAFTGRSNVGKSSLINDLVGRKKLARTSSTPGRTQIINFFNVEDKWIFVDLPGYGFAKVAREKKAHWGPMIEECLTEDKRIRLVVMIVDVRRKPTAIDLVMKEWLDESEIPYLVVATKSDKLSSQQLHKSVIPIQDAFSCSVIPYSTATGMGKGKLWQVFKRI